MAVARIDLTAAITADPIGIELTDWQRQWLESLPTATITLNGYWDTPRRSGSSRYVAAAWHGYQLGRALRRQRLSRMRTAYRCRRS